MYINDKYFDDNNHRILSKYGMNKIPMLDTV